MRRAFLLLLLILTLLTASPARAGDAPPRSTVITKLRLPKAKTSSTSNAQVDQLFDELEGLEAPELEDHKAGDLTNTELIVVIIFLIIFFPLGIILLIIFLIDDDD